MLNRADCEFSHDRKLDVRAKSCRKTLSTKTEFEVIQSVNIFGSMNVEFIFSFELIKSKELWSSGCEGSEENIEEKSVHEREVQKSLKFKGKVESNTKLYFFLQWGRFSK